MSKKKETIHQLTLIQGDLKQSSHRTELQLKAQNSQQLEKVRSLEIELAKLNKQLEKAVFSKETHLQVGINYIFFGVLKITFSLAQQTSRMETLAKDLFSSRGMQYSIFSTADE